MKFNWEPIWSALALGATMAIGFWVGAAHERQKISEERTIIQNSSSLSSPNVIGGGNVTITSEPCDHWVGHAASSKQEAER